MRRLVQFVALALALCLAAPPAALGAVCQMVYPGAKPAMAGCCAGMHHAGMPGGCHETAVAVLHAGTCADGCCTMTPPSPAAPTATVKAAPDAAQTAAEPAVLPATPAVELAVAGMASPASPPIARYVLLHTFRI